MHHTSSLLSSTSDPKPFIDSTFPSLSSLKGIPDVIEKLKSKKAELEVQSQDMRGSGRVAAIHREGTQAMTQLTQMDAECAAMALDVRMRLMIGEHHVGAANTDAVQEPDAGKAKVIHQLRAYTTQVQQLEQARKYLMLLLKIQELDSQVRSLLARISSNPPTSITPLSLSSPPTSPSTSEAAPVNKPSSPSPSSPSPSASSVPRSIGEVEGVHDALSPFLQLMKVHEVLARATLGQEGPLALKDVLNKKISVLARDLVGRARSAFKTCLDGLGWPSAIPIATSKLDLRTSRSDEPPLRRSTATHMDSPELVLLGRSFTDLLVLQSSLQDQHRRTQSPQRDSQKRSEETLWVVDIMLEPIIKRFRYHFSGKKATNRLDKPEWPLHHTKKIVQEHTAFLSLFIQNLLLEEGSRVDAKTEFVKGLVLAINTKFRRDIGTVLTDKHLLFHTVKELLAFEKHMRSVHAYPVKEENGEYVPSSPSLPTCLDVLEDDGVFDLWLQAETELGVESLYAHISSPGAWETEDSDDHRAAKCSHMLLALLHSFTERFRYLKAPHHQLEFFHGTQHRLLEIFLKEVAVWREWKDWKDWREWWGSTGSTTSLRWIEMLEKWCVFANSLLLIRSAIKDWSDQLFFLLLYKMKLEENGERDSDSEAPLVGSIFDDILKQYKALQRQFVDALITNISSAFKRATTTVYFKKKKIWSGGLQDSSDISVELCVGLEDLAAGLRRGAAGLAPSLFAKVWRGVAASLDNYVLTSLLPPSSHAFAAGGAAQFVRDMQALFLLFRPYSSHPENHFRSIKDAMKIVTLPLHERTILVARLEEGREKERERERDRDRDRDTRDRDRDRDRERERARERDVLVQYGISKIDEESAIYICNMRVV